MFYCDLQTCVITQNYLACGSKHVRKNTSVQRIEISLVKILIFFFFRKNGPKNTFYSTSLQKRIFDLLNKLLLGLGMKSLYFWTTIRIAIYSELIILNLEHFEKFIHYVPSHHRQPIKDPKSQPQTPSRPHQKSPRIFINEKIRPMLKRLPKSPSPRRMQRSLHDLQSRLPFSHGR